MPGAEPKDRLKIWRYTIILAVVWVALIIVSYVLNQDRLNLAVNDIARTNARAYWEKDILYRRWNAGFGGVYVPITPEVQPNPYLDVENREITDLNGRQYTLINPAYMTRQVHELQEKTIGAKGHITSLNPIRPANAPDEWERAALRRFEEGEVEVSSILVRNGHHVIRLMRPLMVEDSCLKCHAKQGYKLGQIRGGISVTVPIAEARDVFREEENFIIFSHILVGVLGLMLMGVISGGLTRRMRERYESEAQLKKANTLLRAEVEERKHAQRELLRIQAAVDDATDAVMILKNDGETIYVNHAFLERFGMPASDITCEERGKIFRSPDLAKGLFTSVLAGHNQNKEIQMVDKNGSLFFALVRASSILDEGRNVLGVLFIITDISARRELEIHLDKMARVDSLTGLANRRALDENLSVEWWKATRSRSPLAILVIDIDYFKRFNDTNGHLAGDQCLREIAHTLEKATRRASDFVARFGGEEFVYVLPDTDLMGAEIVANKVRTTVEELKIPHPQSDVSPYVTVSIGVASMQPSANHFPETLLDRADKALFIAKESGRNRINSSS